ncbi:hypothetical protein [Levilactobacillus yiduensis]|nr:hypothetical protein [Levilactobacillus yiduensis]
MDKQFYNDRILGADGHEQIIQVTDRFIQFDDGSIPLRKVNAIDLQLF